MLRLDLRILLRNLSWNRLCHACNLEIRGEQMAALAVTRVAEFRERHMASTPGSFPSEALLNTEENPAPGESILNQRSMAERQVVVIGGGPAGLTAAYELTKLNVRPLVFEKQSLVGGLARTESYKGFSFDLGGHRFFTKSRDVQRVWQEVLGNDFIRRPRLSRIYYKRKFFYYPLKPLNALFGLGFVEAIRIVLSYVWWHFFPYRQEETFEQWVTNRFGRRLFLTFFKTYTEKVWGIPCSELKAEWAAQRIKNLSLKTAVLNMFFTPRKTIKTLIEEFDYPRLGPGMMWNAVREKINQCGGKVHTQTEVTRVHRHGNRIHSIEVTGHGQRETIEGTDFISSMPVTALLKRLDPAPPQEVLDAANHLHYRDFLTVCLVVDRADLFPDNWIYVHDPEVKVGRIQNFRNWSPDMVPDPGKTSLGLEYFCTEGDDLWTMTDADLIELGKKEIARIGLAQYADIEDGCVCRVEKAYPVYDSAYRDHLTTVQTFVDSLENCQTIGRNGLHRYNNQDHAMLTGMFAVRNLMLGECNNLWNVNTDAEYHEEYEEEAQASTHEVVEVLQDILTGAFPKLDRNALGLSVGITLGVVFLLVTLLVQASGERISGFSLGLLSQYFPGYRVTIVGSFLGLMYGFLIGFLCAWVFAFLRNAGMLLYFAYVRRHSETQILRRFLDYI